MNLPPALTVFSQALMALLFGFLGLMCAVPLLAATVVAIQMIYVQDVVGDQAGIAAPPKIPGDGSRDRRRYTRRDDAIADDSARAALSVARTVVPRYRVGRFPTPVAAAPPRSRRRSGSSGTISARRRWAATRCARWSSCSAT